MTSGGIDKLQFYKRIGIPEVWFWESGKIKIHRLRGGEYEQVNRSGLLPDLDIVLLSQYISYLDQYEAVAEFVKIIRQQ